MINVINFDNDPIFLMFCLFHIITIERERKKKVKRRKIKGKKHGIREYITFLKKIKKYYSMIILSIVCIIIKVVVRFYICKTTLQWIICFNFYFLYIMNE